MSLQDRVALVTGATAGIGAAIARRLAADGAAVACADVRPDGPTATVTAIEQANGRASAVIADLADPAAVARMVADTIAAYGRIDILVNNAGVGRTQRFLDVSLELWNTTLAINMTAPMLAAQHAARDMASRGWGRIVNIASIAGLAAGTGRTAYGASKAGIIGLTRQMAIELAADGITANAVAPGPVETDMTRQSHTAQTRKAYHDRTPMRRYGRPEEIAAGVAFLASDQASLVTGQVLTMDGGILATLALMDDVG